MNAINYPSDKLTDDFLHAHADLGDRVLDEEAFQYRPTNPQKNKMNYSKKIALPSEPSAAWVCWIPTPPTRSNV
jgi:hypothetical protein